MPALHNEPLNKFELSYLLIDVLRPVLFVRLTGIHPEKVLHHIFGVPVKTFPREKLPWTDAETRQLRFLLELIRAVKGPYDYGKFPGRVNDLVDAGVRQWFKNVRTHFEGDNPSSLPHAADWNPDDPKMQKLLELAKKDGNPFYKSLP